MQVQLREVEFEIVPAAGTLEIAFYVDGVRVSEVLNPCEIELLILWLEKYGVKETSNAPTGTDRKADT